MASNHRVTHLEKIPVPISKDEAPTPWSVVMVMAFVYFLLVISSFSNLAWHFSLFRSVYSSFHNRLDLIREPAFYWVFYFIFPVNDLIRVCFIIRKDEKGFFVLVQ